MSWKNITLKPLKVNKKWLQPLTYEHIKRKLGIHLSEEVSGEKTEKKGLKGEKTNKKRDKKARKERKRKDSDARSSEEDDVEEIGYDEKDDKEPGNDTISLGGSDAEDDVAPPKKKKKSDLDDSYENANPDIVIKTEPIDDLDSSNNLDHSLDISM